MIKRLQFYNIKILKTKSYIEYYFYEYARDLNKNTINRRKKRNFEELSLKEKADSFERKEKYYKNKKQDLIRLIDYNFNFKKYNQFITLTFKNPIFDYKIAKNELNKFIKRLRYLFKRKNKELKYFAVFEHHKSGSFHIHMIVFNSFFIDDLDKIWGKGFIKVKKIQNNHHVSLYLMKYLMKEENTTHYRNRYLKSQNLLNFNTKKLYLNKEKKLEYENIIKNNNNMVCKSIYKDYYSYLKNNTNINCIRYYKIKNI